MDVTQKEILDVRQQSNALHNDASEYRTETLKVNKYTISSMAWVTEKRSDQNFQFDHDLFEGQPLH
jgi:hypothetical protein